VIGHESLPVRNGHHVPDLTRGAERPEVNGDHFHAWSERYAKQRQGEGPDRGPHRSAATCALNDPRGELSGHDAANGNAREREPDCQIAGVQAIPN